MISAIAEVPSKQRIVATKEHRKQVKALLDREMTVVEICASVGLSASSVNKIKKRLGYVTPKPKKKK